MLDIQVGGGVMELVNKAQLLVEPLADKTANDAFRSKLEA